MATTDVNIVLSCAFVLDYREHHPFVTVYLTKDVAADPSQYAVVQSRPATSRIDEAVVTLTAAASSLTRVEPDAALCIQGFCHLENSSGEPCIHRTGHCNVLLKALASNTNLVELPFNNRTDDNTERGRVVVSAVNPLTFKNAIKFAPATQFTLTDANADRHMDALNEYRDRADAIVHIVPPVRPDIPLSRLPFYAFNTLAAPPIAFILFDVPRNPEEYYLNALRMVLRRRHRGPASVSDAQLLSAFMDKSKDSDVATWAERGAVLCSVVAVFVNACPYITDFGLWTEKRTSNMALRSVEEFTRTVRLTRSGDCEDFTVEMVMELADILTNQWTSAPMRLLQHVRQQYVAQLPLKMVERPAVYSEKPDKIGKSTTVKPAKPFAMHNNVDLVPVELFVEMQGRLAVDTTPEELWPSAAAMKTNELLLQKRRSKLVSGNRDLGILIAEGTGMYRPDGAVDEARSERKHLFRAHPQAFAMAKHQIREKARDKSRFYLTTVSAIVWDTFALYSAEVPTTAQTFYTTYTPRGLTYAADHPAYVRADPAVGIHASLPATPEEMQMMYHMQRYDHPIPVIAMADGDDMKQLEAMLVRGIPSEGFREAWGLARLSREVVRLGRLQSDTDVYVDYHFPANTMNSTRIMDLWFAVQKSGIVNQISYYVEPVAMGLVLVLIRFRCSHYFSL